jgi:hypothetical protein
MVKQSGSPAVDVARERRDPDEVVTLSTGVKAKIRPVAASLIDEVTSRVEDPDVPIWHNPEKNRDELNPSDPRYLTALAKVNRQRGQATVDAMVLFGVELMEEVPADDAWLHKLQYLERRGHLNLSAYDLKDPLDREFLYKRFVAVGVQDLELITERSAVSPEEVAKAKASFQG